MIDKKSDMVFVCPDCGTIHAEKDLDFCHDCGFPSKFFVTIKKDK